MRMFLFAFALLLAACEKKEGKQPATSCNPTAATLRTITNVRATVRTTATVDAVQLIEQGTIDGVLIPCNMPLEFYQNGLQVTISGDVKRMPDAVGRPCCYENIVLTNITR